MYGNAEKIKKSKLIDVWSNKKLCCWRFGHGNWITVYSSLDGLYASEGFGHFCVQTHNAKGISQFSVKREVFELNYAVRF